MTIFIQTHASLHNVGVSILLLSASVVQFTFVHGKDRVNVFVKMTSEEEEVHSLLSRHRIQIIRELNETKLVPVLVDKNILNGSDEELMKNECDSEKKCSILIEFVSRNGFEKFKEFCYAIETECPQLIEDLINDRLKYGKCSIKNFKLIELL